MTTGAGQASYLYAVVGGNHTDRLGPIGLDEARVILVPYGQLSVAVHACSANPYDSRDLDVVKGWVVAHQRVVDQVMARHGTVLPLTFNTIVVGTETENATQRVCRWLEENREGFVRKFHRIRGKREYGIQVFYYLPSMMERAARTEPIRRLAEVLAGKGKGTAYLMRAQLEKRVREEVTEMAGSLAKELLGLFQQECADLVVDKVREANDDQRMLLNLSVLLEPDREDRLGTLLDEVGKRPGLRVRFTGPWAPYSFVRTP